MRLLSIQELPVKLSILRLTIFLFAIDAFGFHAAWVPESKSMISQSLSSFAPLLWSDSPEAKSEYIKFLRARLSRNGEIPAFLDERHFETQKVQRLLDRLDAHLRQKSPLAMEHIPKPVALVWKSPIIYSFVGPATHCVPAFIDRTYVQTNESSDLSHREFKNSQIAGLTFSGVVFPRPLSTPCPWLHNKTSLQLLVDYLNKVNASCQVYLTSHPSFGLALKFGQDCKWSKSWDINEKPQNDSLTPQSYLGGMQVTSTSSIILISTGMIQQAMQEEHLAAILAHELAHYYRAHPAINPKFAYYFYDRSETTNELERPSPTESRSLLQLGFFLLKQPRKFYNNEAVKLKLQQSLDQHLGYYTLEQEADRLAVLLLHELGMPSEALGEYLMELAKKSQPKSPPSQYDWDFKTCMDFDPESPLSSPLAIPIGDFSDPHHNFCFRSQKAYSLSRRLK